LPPAIRPKTSPDPPRNAITHPKPNTHLIKTERSRSQKNHNHLKIKQKILWHLAGILSVARSGREKGLEKTRKRPGKTRKDLEKTRRTRQNLKRNAKKPEKNRKRRQKQKP